MQHRQYKVALHTPLGERYGKMKVIIEHNQLKGILEILKKAAPFHGEIHADGNCKIKGEIFTLTRTISYEGAGQINETSLHLILKSEKESFRLSGTAEDNL